MGRRCHLASLMKINSNPKHLQHGTQSYQGQPPPLQIHPDFHWQVPTRYELLVFLRGAHTLLPLLVITMVNGSKLLLFCFVLHRSFHHYPKQIFCERRCNEQNREWNWPQLYWIGEPDESGAIKQWAVNRSRLWCALSDHAPTIDSGFGSQSWKWKQVSYLLNNCTSWAHPTGEGIYRPGYTHRQH